MMLYLVLYTWLHGWFTQPDSSLTCWISMIFISTYLNHPLAQPRPCYLKPNLPLKSSVMLGTTINVFYFIATASITLELSTSMHKTYIIIYRWNPLISKLQWYWPLHHYSVINSIPLVTPWTWLRNFSPPNFTCTHSTFWDHNFIFHRVPAWNHSQSTIPSTSGL